MPSTLSWLLAEPDPTPAPGTSVGNYTVEAYARQLKLLLPGGAATEYEKGSIFSKLLYAIAEELARVDGRAADLLNEWDPSTADETIEQWESFVQLPDTRITAIPGTLAARRLAVVQKLTGRGGQNVEFFVNLAADCGYTVTIHNYVSSGDIMRAQTARVNDRVYGEAYAYAMRIDVQPPAGTALTHAELEAVINHVCHSHITVVYNYL